MGGGGGVGWVGGGGVTCECSWDEQFEVEMKVGTEVGEREKKEQDKGLRSG